MFDHVPSPRLPQLVAAVWPGDYNFRCQSTRGPQHVDTKVGQPALTLAGAAFVRGDRPGGRGVVVGGARVTFKSALTPKHLQIPADEL